MWKELPTVEIPSGDRRQVSNRLGVVQRPLKGIAAEGGAISFLCARLSGDGGGGGGQRGLRLCSMTGE